MTENTQNKSIQEMKSYVERLPKILEKGKKLTLHTAIAECIKEHTERDPFIETLKVLFFYKLKKKLKLTCSYFWKAQLFT